MPETPQAAVVTGTPAPEPRLRPESPGETVAPYGKPGVAAWVQCRYRATAVPGMVAAMDAGQVRFALAEPVRAITPGQSAALYDEAGRLLGGGVIASSVR